MTRTITVTNAASAAAGETITGVTYRLLAADGTTVLSTANPPYVGVSDGLLYVEQTATQSDAQTNVTTVAIPGRITDLAASAAVRPVLTWTDIAGETSYEIHRGAAGFTPDVSGGTTLLETVAAGVQTYTDGTMVGDGVTSYGYRVVAKTAFGYTIGSEATTTPAAPTTEYTTSFATAGNLTSYSPAWVAGPQYSTDPLVASGGLALLRGNGVDGSLYDPVVPASADQSITATLRLASQTNEVVSLVFRASGAGNSNALVSYRVTVLQSGGVYVLRIEYSDGTGIVTTLGTPASLAGLTIGSDYTFYGTVFTLGGNVQINGHVGGVSVSATDSSASKITTAGRRGLYGVANDNPSTTTGLLLLDYTGAVT